MKNLSLNQQHALDAHKNTLINREQNKVGEHKYAARRDCAKHLISGAYQDTNNLPEHNDRVRGTRRHYDTNNSQSEPIPGPADMIPPAQMKVSREPKPSGQLADFNEKAMNLPAARGKTKRVDHMWNSNIFAEEAEAEREIKYRKPAPSQESVTHGLLRMDHGLPYREDPITKKVS